LKTTRMGGTEGIDFISCEVCGQHGRDLGMHYKKVHPEYVPSKVKCQSIIDSVMGEKNPAYQHGGKYSPFSKNFIKYKDEECRKQAQEKARNTVRENGTNPFDRNYYKTDVDYSEAQGRDLDWFIKKYGDEEGKKRHAIKTEKWLKTLSEKSDEEKQRINRLKIGRSGAISKAEKN